MREMKAANLFDGDEEEEDDSSSDDCSKNITLEA